MTKISVNVKKDFLETLTTSKPIDCLSELIWNGFDANANKVQIFLHHNDMDGVESIVVRDNGYGIDKNKVESYFGALGDSWKKVQQKQNGRALHGKNGKGRFKSFGLGHDVVWDTVCKIEDKLISYTIRGSASALDGFEISDPVQVNSSQTGTTVTITNLAKEYRVLDDGTTAQNELAKKFAAYLTEYPNLTLEYSGKKIDPQTVMESQTEIPQFTVTLKNGKTIGFNLTIIQWKISAERVLHFCDAKGISLFEFSLAKSIKAPGYNFTAYIKSDVFRELDSMNQLGMAELDPDIQSILKQVKLKVNEHFRKLIVEEQSRVIEKWKNEEIYPYDDVDTLDPIEAVERQVFDILAVNVENYLPDFENADSRSKKFTFRLLAQAVKENPDSLQTIISEVLDLKKEAQDDLAELLERTSLSSIISSAKIVADRLDFINALDSLIYGKETKKRLLERDQLHKILEKEAWIFDENFTLSASEIRLDSVLEKHVDKLGDRQDPQSVQVEGDSDSCRIDLLLKRAIQPRQGEYDFLVVELKRPSQKINNNIISQIENYAIAVVNDERFAGTNTRWKFIAVSNEFDATAESKAAQRDRPRGKIYDDATKNVTVWIKTWAEIITDARTRLTFFNNQLKYQADLESAKSYLTKTHEKFIPTQSLLS